MMLRPAGALLAAPVALILSTPPAPAIEAAKVADAIGAALVKGGNAQVAYESAALNDGDVVIVGITFSGTTSGQTVRFAETVVEGPAETENGLFSSPRITFTEGAGRGEPTGTVASVTLTDVTVLDPETVGGEGFAEAIRYRTAEIAGVKVVRDAAPTELLVERVTVELGEAAGDAPRPVKGTVTGLSISPDLFEHRRFALLARARLRLENLGYEALVFDVDFAGSWNRKDGAMHIDRSTLTFRDNAKVSVSGTVANLPDPRVLNDKGVVTQVATLEVHDLVVRYEEDSLAGRLFDLMAKEQEVSRAEYVEQLSLALPFLLASLTHPDFREELIAELRVFFAEPHSFTVVIDPDAPISGNDIISAARSALGTLPDRLKASVEANKQD